MKICLISDHIDYGGSAIIVKRWIAKLLERGHTIILFTSKGQKLSIKPHKRLHIHTLRGLPLPRTQKRIYFALPALRSMYKIYKVLKEADVLHIFSSPSILALTSQEVAKFVDIPIVSSIHGVPENFTENLGIKNGIAKKILYHYFTKSFDRSDTVISPSLFIKKLYKKYGLKRKTIVISNGIDRKIFNEKVSAQSFLKKYHLDKNFQYVLFVGRLMAERKVDLLLRAAKIVTDKIPLTKFIIVGDGYKRKNLELLAKKLHIKDKVIFTGFISDEFLPSTYAACDLFIFTSVVPEIQGLVLLEAISTGSPIVGSRIGAIPELVVNNFNGFTFRPFDEKDLAKKILIILRNKNIQKEFSKNSIYIAKKHDINKSIDEIEKIYKGLIHEKRKITYL